MQQIIHHARTCTEDVTRLQDLKLVFGRRKWFVISGFPGSSGRQLDVIVGYSTDDDEHCVVGFRSVRIERSSIPFLQNVLFAEVFPMQVANVE